VSLTYATFAVDITGGMVSDAPPVARWAIGKPWDDVARYYLRRGATVKRMP